MKTAEAEVRPLRHRIVEEDLSSIVDSDLPWDQFAGRTVLVSGASGFLPAYMIESLLYLNESGRQQPVKVLGLVRNRESALLRFSAYHGRDDLEFIVQDVSEPLSIDRSIDYVIHAASQASPKHFAVDPVGTIAPNLLGTYNLLKLAAEKKSLGFLLFSSAEVYGELGAGNLSIKETDFGYLDPTGLRSCYSEGKRAAETLCVAWWQQYAVPAKIARPFHTYGPGMRLDDGRVFADFVADVINSREITVKSDGSSRRAFCYLADATTAFFTVLLKGEVGQAYNVGNDEAEISIKGLAELLASLTFRNHNASAVRLMANQTEDYLQSQVSRSCPNTSKIRSIGWKPTTALEPGFRRTIESFL